MLTAVLVVFAGNWIVVKMRVEDAVGAVGVHGVSGFLGMFWVGIFAAGYPTGLNNVESSIGGQLMGMATFLPLGFLTGWGCAYLLKKANLLRVPVEVEIEGLDLVEYGTLVYPEMGVIAEEIVEPDGTLVASATITQLELTNVGHGNGAGSETLEKLR
jgi:ammonia channel protein AmtB